MRDTVRLAPRSAGALTGAPRLSNEALRLRRSRFTLVAALAHLLSTIR